jgi:enoyl-CoA hydratase
MSTDPNLEQNDEPIRYSAKDGVAILTLNKPPVNALSSAAYKLLARISDRLASDDSIRVAIFTAEGPRIFCGGADVKELAAQTPDGRAAFFAMSNETRQKFSNIPIPVIAAITGPAAGAGVTYPAYCDYRIAADHAYFKMPEIDRGSVAGGGAMFLALGVLTGPMRMMLYTGRSVPAQEALEMHLVDEVVPYARLMEVALERATMIAAKPRHALMAMKTAIRKMSYNPNWDEEGYAAMQKMNIEMMQRPETQEGYSAFMEKRKPRY